MKDLQEISKLKNSNKNPFGNGYVFLIERLTDYYIDKLDGKERIKKELQEWELEARKQIVDDLGESIRKYPNQRFDESEFLSL